VSGLSSRDVVSLLAEHAECHCLDVHPAECPKHSLEALVADFDTDVLIFPGMLPMEALSGYLRDGDETPRVIIALVLWRIVSEFVSTEHEEPLEPLDGQTISDAAEDYVRRNAEEAESCTMICPGGPSGLTAKGIRDILTELSLLDAYARLYTPGDNL
jgi:hypothetical protein